MGSLPSVHALLQSAVKVASPIERFSDLAGKPIGWSWPASVSTTALGNIEKVGLAQIAKPSSHRAIATIFSRESGNKIFFSGRIHPPISPLVIGAMVCGIAFLIAYEVFYEKYRSHLYKDPIQSSQGTSIRDPAESSVFSLIFPALEIASWLSPSPKSDSDDLNDERYIFPTESSKVDPVNETEFDLSNKIYLTSGMVQMPLEDQDTAPVRIIKDEKTGVEIRISREHGKEIVVIQGGILLADVLRKYLSELIIPNNAEDLINRAKVEEERQRAARLFSPSEEQIPDIAAHHFRPLTAQGNIAHFHIPGNAEPIEMRYGIFYPTKSSLGDASYHLYIPLFQPEIGRDLFQLFIRIVSLVFIEESMKAGFFSSVQPRNPFLQKSVTEFEWMDLISGQILASNKILPTVDRSIQEIQSQESAKTDSKKMSVNQVLRISFIWHLHEKAEEERFAALALLRGLIARGRLTIARPIRQ